MAINKIPESFTYAADAAADHSSNLHKLAAVNSDGDIALCGDGAQMLGTLIEVNTSGNPVTVQFGGIAKVKLGGTVAAGGAVASGASGVGVAAAAGDYVFGQALNGGVSGDVISVAVVGSTRHA